MALGQFRINSVPAFTESIGQFFFPWGKSPDINSCKASFMSNIQHKELREKSFILYIHSLTQLNFSIWQNNLTYHLLLSFTITVYQKVDRIIEGRLFESLVFLFIPRVFQIVTEMQIETEDFFFFSNTSNPRYYLPYAWQNSPSPLLHKHVIQYDPVTIKVSHQSFLN